MLRRQIYEDSPPQGFFGARKGEEGFSIFSSLMTDPPRGPSGTAVRAYSGGPGGLHHQVIIFFEGVFLGNLWKSSDPGTSLGHLSFSPGQVKNAFFIIFRESRLVWDKSSVSVAVLRCLKE